MKYSTKNPNLISIIFSLTGLKLIQHLPLQESQAVDTRQLAIGAGVPQTTTYRIMSIISRWPNIGIKLHKNGLRNETLYYIHSQNFSLSIDPDGIRLEVE